MLLLFCFHLRIRPSSYFRFSFDVDLDQQNHIDDDDDDRPTLFIQFNSSKVQETNRFGWWWWWWWRFRTIGHILLAYNPIDTTRPWKALVDSSVHRLLVNTNNSNDQYGTLNGLWPSTYCFTLLLSIVVCYLFAGLSPFISTFYNISP